MIIEIVEIRFRRGTSAEWVAKNPVLSPGEPGLESNTGKLKIGNGSDAWTTLPYLTGSDSGNSGDGASAYELAVQQGYVGSLNEWLSSLHGEDGDPGLSAYQIAIAEGFIGTPAEWIDSLQGADGVGTSGLSAYEVAVANGFVGGQVAWLSSLQGVDGDPGPPGDDGVGSPGLSAYEVAVENGFVGDETAWLESLHASSSPIEWDDIPNKPAVIAAGTTAEAARSVINAEVVGHTHADMVTSSNVQDVVDITFAAWTALGSGRPSDRLYLIVG